MAVNGILLGQNDSNNNLTGKFLKNKAKSNFFQKIISLNLDSFDFFTFVKGYLITFHYNANNGHTLKRQKINANNFTLESEESLSLPISRYKTGTTTFLSIQDILFFAMVGENIYKISTNAGKTWSDLTLEPNIQMNSSIFSIGDGFLYLPINSSKTLQKLTIKNNTLKIVEENKVWSINRDVTGVNASAGLSTYYSPYIYFYHIPSNTLFTKNTRNDSSYGFWGGTRKHVIIIRNRRQLEIYDIFDTSLSSPVKTITGISYGDSNDYLKFYHTLDYIFYSTSEGNFILDDATLTEIKISAGIPATNYYQGSRLGFVYPIDSSTNILIFDLYKDSDYNSMRYKGKISFQKIVPQYEIFIENQSIGKIPSDLEFDE